MKLFTSTTVLMGLYASALAVPLLNGEAVDGSSLEKRHKKPKHHEGWKHHGDWKWPTHTPVSFPYPTPTGTPYGGSFPDFGDVTSGFKSFPTLPPHSTGSFLPVKGPKGFPTHPPYATGTTSAKVKGKGKSHGGHHN